MGSGLRKLALTVHLTVSVGWIGAAVAYLALGISAATTESPPTIRAAWTAMEVTGRYVIVPLAVASVLTGLVMALGTRWGLFRHYWVLISFTLAVVAAVVVLLHMPTVSSVADAVRGSADPELAGFGGDLLHPALGLVVLLVVQVLNLYKPAGMTRYGRRKQRSAAAR
ncbi:MAG TPA: hypothetical protein VG709_04255 [Actinomycetota bacterium]|nr:hypothetical protein [Actinomycetota bacterium]